MGGGSWSTPKYDDLKRRREERGESAFVYSDRVISTGRAKVHDDLNPHGMKVRESCDNAEHPESLAIAVWFDQTGSMSGTPAILQAKLPELFGLLLRKGYARDPQILTGAFGDATCDNAPLGVSQFESDNRIDEQLRLHVLEGGGGHYGEESYELPLYVMARHTTIDCWDKRRKKGYCFLIGDEMAYPAVKRSEVQQLLGQTIQEDIPIEQIVAEVQQRYHTFFILPHGTSGWGNRNVINFWSRLFGQNLIELEELPDGRPAVDAICETIALIIGTYEGVITGDEGAYDLAEFGIDHGLIHTASTALSRHVATTDLAKGTGGNLPGLVRGDKKSRRL